MFGTDGIRGIYGEKITPMLFFGLGLALSEVFGGDAVVAMDTRVSGDELRRAVIDGLTLGGVNVTFIGIVPSPALAKAISYFGADFGVMITASHNPPEYNGIKIFNRYGCKPDRDKERLVEFYLSHPPLRRGRRGTKREEDYAPIYAADIGSRFGPEVGIDFAFGAASSLSKFLMGEHYNDSLDGSKINVGCGALHPEFLRSQCNLRWGFALDGDADRLAVVYKGEVLDGDSVLYNLAIACNSDRVVATVMSNSALKEALAERGIAFETTPVGDKYVGERMRQLECELGGEQSGHFILSSRNCTGDALGAAAFLFNSLGDNDPIRLNLFPQVAFSYDRSIAANPRFDSGVAALRTDFDGRLVVRLSGTEPKVRFMAEHRDGVVLQNFVSELKEFLDGLSDR